MPSNRVKLPFPHARINGLDIKTIQRFVVQLEYGESGTVRFVEVWSCYCWCM